MTVNTFLDFHMCINKTPLDCISRLSLNMDNGNTDMKHLVIGHSQLRNLDTYKFPNQPELDLNMDFEWISGGKAPQLAKLIKGKLVQAKTPMRVSAIIWQNSITDMSLKEMEDIVLDMEQFLKNYPSHRVAFPECQFVPKLESSWDKIAKLNSILNDFNLRQGFNRYALHKVTMMYSKQKKGLVVRQTSYREYNNAIRNNNNHDDVNSLGYHIDEGAPKTRYAQAIRRFHLHGFNDHSPRPSAQTPAQEKGNKIFFAQNPVNKMKDPQSVDAREIINKIKRDNKNQETATKDSSPIMNLEEQEENDSIMDDKVTQEETEPLAEKSDLKEWLDQGTSKGYLKTFKKLVLQKQRSKEKRKRRESSSSSSESEDKDKGRNKRHRKKRRESSSDTDSDKQDNRNRRHRRRRRESSSGRDSDKQDKGSKRKEKSRKKH